MGVYSEIECLPTSRVQQLPETDRYRLGQNISRYRAKLGLTQEQLAEAAAIDRRFIQKLEVGELGTSLAVLKRLRKALKVGWEDLLKGL